MGQGKDVVPVDTLIGRSVVSLSSGNILGTVRDVFVDPLNGVLIGFTLDSADGLTTHLAYDDIHSFGRDAIMVPSDEAAATESAFSDGLPHARELIGTKIITDEGNILGQVTNIHTTVTAPPLVIYEIQESLLDKLLGRRLYILSSLAHALSADRERLIVPDQTTNLAATSIEKLLDPEGIQIRSITPTSSSEPLGDDTVIMMPLDDGDETVVRVEEEETIVRGVDEDETVIRFRRRTG